MVITVITGSVLHHTISSLLLLYAFYGEQLRSDHFAINLLRLSCLDTFFFYNVVHEEPGQKVKRVDFWWDMTGDLGVSCFVQQKQIKYTKIKIRSNSTVRML